MSHVTFDGLAPLGSGAVALALASFAALLTMHDPSWENLTRALEHTSRREVPSPTASGLTCAILGAAWGFGAIPRHLFRHLNRRDELIDLTRDLHLNARNLGIVALSEDGDVPTTGAYSRRATSGGFSLPHTRQRVAKIRNSG